MQSGEHIHVQLVLGQYYGNKKCTLDMHTRANSSGSMYACMCTYQDNGEVPFTVVMLLCNATCNKAVLASPSELEGLASR